MSGGRVRGVLSRPDTTPLLASAAVVVLYSLIALAAVADAIGDAASVAAPAAPAGLAADGVTGAAGEPGSSVGAVGERSVEDSSAPRAPDQTTSAPSGGASRPGATPPGSPAVTAPGEVRIGFHVLGDNARAFAAVGVSAPNSSEADIRARWEAVIELVNSRGGLAGRTIVPSFHFTDVAQGTHDSRAQAACDQFTQDDQVFAVVLDSNATHTLPACLAQRGTVAVDIAGTNEAYDAADLADLAPYLYLPARMNLSRFGNVIDGLATTDYFDDGARVGLLRYDTETHRRTATEVIRPALARHGLELTDEFAFTAVQSVSDLSRTSAEASNAAVRFRSSGVNRVIMLPTSAVLSLIFPAAAEGQNYRPRYGLSTDDWPDFIADNAPDGQLDGAIGVGWIPYLDVADSNAVNEANPLWRDCAAVVEDAGQPPESARVCTPLFFLEAVAARAPSFTVEGIRAAADALGDTPYSTLNFATAWAPGRSDGPSAARLLGFDAACGCFAYTGPVRPLP